MADQRVGFLLEKLNTFRRAADNLPPDEQIPPDEQKLLADLDSKLTNLRSFVKSLDTTNSNDSPKIRKQLDDELLQLVNHFLVRFDSNKKTEVRQLTLKDILSAVQDISKKYEELTREEDPWGMFRKFGDEDFFKFEDEALEEGSATYSVAKRTPRDSGLIGKGDLIRFDWCKEELMQLLLDNDYRTKGVLVTGSGGSGKTALVRKVCEDVYVRKHYGTIAWISVPPVNDPHLIRHEIFLQLLFENKAPVPHHLNAFSVYDQTLEQQIISLLQKERCLIVVDNLVDQSTLVTFQNASHSVETGRVIFITRHDMGSRNWNRDWGKDYLLIYKLDNLSEEESRELLLTKTFPEKHVPSPLEEVCRYIIEKCAGLPQAIDLCSRLLRNKKEEWEDDGKFDEGEDAERDWSTILRAELSHKFDLIQEVLKVTYQDDGLGSCLLYLSIFPENSPISCMRVSRLWAAEGFLHDGSDCNLRKAEDFLQELLDKKLIYSEETRSDEGLSTFKVYNLVRDIIVSLSDHRNLLRITSEGSTNRPERARYLSVQGAVKNLNEEILSEVRSLFMFNVSSNKDETTKSEASPWDTLKDQLLTFNVKLLQVLDLTGAPWQNAPDVLFESTSLRYLALRDTSIKVIPNFIGRLVHLEFLDLKQSLVTELPKEVEGLKRIRHILIYHHEKDPLIESYNLIGFKASCSVGGLKKLEKLCFVESDDSILKDLGNLTKLTRLGITKLRKEHGKGLCTSLKELKKLESLNLHAFDEDEILDVHYLSSPPESLKRLYLHGRLDKLPNWISPHCHLTKIVLRWSCLKGATRHNKESHMEAAAQQEKESHLEAATHQEEDLLATLGKLPELVELELRRAYHGRQLDFKNGQFPKLKILLLDELGRLRSMSLEEGTMPCLEDLTISRCQWLERIPTGIEHITPTLKALEFFDMSREFYKMVPDDYRNSKDKPKVYFTQWRPGQWRTIPLGKGKCDECFAGEH